MSKSEIEIFSKKHDLNLPKGCISFLLKYNGAFVSPPSYCSLPFPKIDGEEIDFSMLFGISTNEEPYDIEAENYIRDEIEYFDNPLIIGSNSSNNYYVINCDNNDESVYCWDRTHIHYDDNYDYAEVDEEGKIYKFSDTFDEFFDAIFNNIGEEKDIQIVKL
ncbi:SMI1/KNR4 family protein [Vibrio quintilis]|nr:SMI1/KNR4 family protein [Vibrio quintilis]